MGILIRRRQAAVFCFFIISLGLLTASLWTIQIRDGEKYAAMALEQGSVYVPLEEVGRGKILDRNLLSLTGEWESERIVVFPEVIDREEVIRGLSEILNAPGPVLADLLQGAPRYLPYQLSQAQAEAVRERGWKGVAVLPVSFRYGDKLLAAQVIGHLGKITSREELSILSSRSGKSYKYDDLVGKIGLEGMYESELKGGRPERAARIYHDAAGNILNGSVITVEEGVRDSSRQDLVLTIDARIQQVVENVMDDRALKGAVVVMEAGTGDLLAMAGRPAFHPARVEDYLQKGGGERFFDHCTALYQPGSIFKIVVAAAALEEGVAGTGSLLTCAGAKDDLIHCWNDAGHGDITFARAFAESCNPAFARVGLSLGAQKIIEYARKLGLDNQSVTGYPVPVDPRQDLSLIAAPYNLVNSSIGQGPVLVSPVQVAAMMNAVVSGGAYRAPRLVKEVRKSSGEAVREFNSEPGCQAIRPDTAAVLRELLELATDEGVAKGSSVPVFGSAGKTGSAQTGDMKHSVNAWFSGYAPRVDPRYIVTILVEEGTSGSESAAPVFREIMEQILRFD